jgi:hypothetical protein
MRLLGDEKTFTKFCYGRIPYCEQLLSYKHILKKVLILLIQYCITRVPTLESFTAEV